MIYAIKEYPKNINLLETINLFDVNNNEWIIKRYNDYGLVIHYNGKQELLLKNFIYTNNNEIMNMVNSNYIHYEIDSFEDFIYLRDYLISSLTNEIFSWLNDLFQERFNLNPNLTLECEVIF